MELHVGTCSGFFSPLSFFCPLLDVANTAPTRFYFLLYERNGKNCLFYKPLLVFIPQGNALLCTSPYACIHCFIEMCSELDFPLLRILVLVYVLITRWRYVSVTAPCPVIRSHDKELGSGSRSALPTSGRRRVIQLSRTAHRLPSHLGVSVGR